MSSMEALKAAAAATTAAEAEAAAAADNTHFRLPERQGMCL
jgi:hypothetical protein